MLAIGSVLWYNASIAPPDALASFLEYHYISMNGKRYTSLNPLIIKGLSA